MKETIKFYLTQFKFGRKLYKGTYYFIINWIPMNCFWSDRLITSCGGRALETEVYE